jgi:hypothetical protein
MKAVPKSAVCPYCQVQNTFDELDPDEQFKQDLPRSLAKSGLVAATTLFNPVAGIVAGGLFLARGVVQYLDGVVVTCASCGKAFRI